MTIRFIKAWAGYSPDDIKTLSGAEETRLVGLGIASFDLDGANDGEEGFVKYRKGLTGGISFGATTTKAATAARGALSRNPLAEEHTTQCAVTGGLWSANLTNALQMSTSQDRFTTEGGVFVSDGNANNFPLKSATVAAGNLGGGAVANAYSVRNAVSFRTSAGQVRFKFYIGGGNSANCAVRAIVDGRVVRGTNLPGKQAGKALTLTGQAAGAQNYINLDFTGAGGAGVDRLVRFEWDEGVTGGTLSHDSGYLVPLELEPVRALFFGDSYFAFGAGSAAGTYALSNVASKIADLLGWSATCSAVGGTGYINNGGSNYAFASAQRISDMSLRTFDEVVIAGGTNDGGSTPAAITAAALATFQAARAAQPAAKIRVIGCWNNELVTAPTTQAQVEAAIKAAFDAWADGNSQWIPVSTDPAGPWITAANKATYIDADGTHARAVIGERYFAERVVQKIRASFALN